MSEFGRKLLESMAQAVEMAQGRMPESEYCSLRVTGHH